LKKTGQVIYDYSLNSNTVSWRGAIKKVTGYTNEEFEKISVNDFIKLIHPGDRETYITKRDEALNDLKSFYLEYRFKKKKRQLYIHSG
jgi:PAS domain-containing protein